MNMQSENISELAMALSKAQGEMQAAIKDSINPFFKSKYADLGSVWDAARPVLSKHGLCVMQTTDILGEKNILITTLAHSSGQWMKSSILINPTKNDSQGVGAAMTYLRRYSLAAIVGVVTEDDDGETAMGRGQTDKKQEQPKKQQPNQNNNIINIDEVKKPLITQKQLDIFIDTCKLADPECVQNMDKLIKDNYGITAYSDLTQECFERCLNWLTRNIELKRSKAMNENSAN